MKSWFLKRVYPKELVEDEMRKFKFCKEGRKTTKVVRGIPHLVTHHPQLKYLGNIHKNFYSLDMNEETKTVFSP